MSEWEEFSAYQGLIADAKREERERIIELIKQEFDEHGFICGSGDYFISIIRGNLVELLEEENE